MIYKTLKKVSDYCQLLDKSKFPATRTINGITFTNNGDGIITINGTATAGAAYQLVMRPFISCKDNHKYLVKGSPAGGSYGSYRITTNVQENGSYVTGFSDSGSGNISNALSSSYAINVLIDIFKGTTVSNLVFKPQLFDLTEMYGVGNEPTTVDEFKADFPNDLYDYKPYCFVPSYKNLLKATDDTIITSYKKSLICTTKNLFDKSLTTIPNDIANGKLIGTTKNGWIVQGNIATDRPVGTAYWANGWFSTGLYNRSYATIKKGMYLKGGDVVTVSAYYTLLESNITDNVGIYLYGTKSVISQLRFPSGVGVKTRVYRTLKIADGQDGLYNPVFTLNSSKILIEDIQIEYGTTPTEYHPYGYL